MDIAVPFPHATRANVECNAPLSRVPYKLEKNARAAGGADAASAAAAEQRKADQAAAGRQAKEEEFQRKLRGRLRKARREQMEAEHSADRLAHEELARLSLLPRGEPTGEPAARPAPAGTASAGGGASATATAAPGRSPLEEVRHQMEAKASAARDLLLLHSGAPDDGEEEEEEEVEDGSVGADGKLEEVLPHSAWCAKSFAALASTPANVVPPFVATGDDNGSVGASCGGSMPRAPRSTVWRAGSEAKGGLIPIGSPSLGSSQVNAAVVSAVRKQAALADRVAARQDCARRAHEEREAAEREEWAEARAKAQEAAVMAEMERLAAQQARLEREIKAASAAAQAKAKSMREQKYLQAERYVVARREQLKQEVRGRRRSRQVAGWHGPRGVTRAGARHGSHTADVSSLPGCRWPIA